MLLKLNFATGDSVGTDDIVLQIETDKVTVDVRYTTGKPGKLKEMLVKEEDTVAVGQEVAVVTEGAEGAPEADQVSLPYRPHLHYYAASWCNAHAWPTSWTKTAVLCMLVKSATVPGLHI